MSASAWGGHLDAVRDTVERYAATPAPPRSDAQARRVIVDTVGCALAGRDSAPVRELESVLAAAAPGGFALPGGDGLGTLAAAQLLATAATWDEACEGHAVAHGRPGVPIVAALLPLATQRSAPLHEVVDALVLGYEVGARCGAWLRVRPGMHVDASWPALGVAAGAARLLGLPAAGILQAIDIAACQLGTGLYLPVARGCTARNSYLGHSATAGLNAAFAAAAGLDAPRDALAVVADDLADADPAPLPGAEVELLPSSYLKPFAAVRHVHYGAVAAGRLRERLRGSTRDVTGIRLRVYEEAVRYCGNRGPGTPIQAQFSLSFGLAAMLRLGRLDPGAYRPGSFDDPELRRLEALVELDADGTRPGRHATVQLRMRGGGTLEESVDSVPGDPDQPFDDERVTAKFVRYTAGGLDPASARRYCASVLEAGARTASLLPGHGDRQGSPDERS